MYLDVAAQIDSDADLDSAPMRLFSGEVLHARLKPKKHVFRYRMFFIQADIDRLSSISRSSPKLFGLNRLRLFSLYEKDYLPGGEGTLRQRLARRLEERGLELPAGQVDLITVPRLLGYAFNPVSFYQCRNQTGELEILVAEVNNTFGETHLYVLQGIANSRTVKESWTRKPKEFHVSPFLDRKGEYAFSHREWEKDGQRCFDLRVDLEKEGQTVFVSRMWGNGVPWTRKNVKSTFFSRPSLVLSAWLTVPRILWEAVKMKVSKNFEVYPRPIADSADTIRSSDPAYVDQACRWLLRKSLCRLKKGGLTLCYPNGETEHFGESNPETNARIFIKNTNLFYRVVCAGDIGFGESYMAKEWETDHLPRVLALFAENIEYFDDRSLWSTVVGRIQNRLKHLSVANSQRQSKKNIEKHYDLSNEFFQTFLDPSMSYSSGIFEKPEDSLEQSQENKIEAILRRAQLKPGMHILEIGSGWGSLAITAAKKYGVKVTSITLSERQHHYAQQRAREEGVEGQVDFQIRDYRQVNEKYDRIVSVEMLEAVGHKYYTDFFSVCDKALKPDGLVVLQVITIPEARYSAYRKSCDWIQRYIFPGGETPSLEALTTAMRKSSGLFVEELENIGVHYARTLREWRKNFHQSEKQILALGFDERFLRMWDYYLAYCEAGFATRAINTCQLVLTRQGNVDLGLAPGYERD